MQMLPQEIIRVKREGKSLSEEMINDFIKGVTENKVTDAQISSFCMAIFFNPLSIQERVALTKAMAHSGMMMNWSGENDLGKPVVDKHSSGGIGDKVSFLLAPILAACGCAVPMIAGRGLGHTGGTVDKGEAIPGYNMFPTQTVFENCVKEIGCAIIGQTKDLAPADKRIYAVRDTTATVENIDLITASILSKKLAEGLNVLVMDIKVGSGAFMETMKDAEGLAKSIVDVANGANVKCSALVTDMNQPLGYTAGNAVEIVESVEFLNGTKQEKRLRDITLELCGEILKNAGLAKDRSEGFQKAALVLDSGEALEKFAAMVTYLGGPKDFVTKYNDYLPKAKIIEDVYADTEGYITEIKTRDIGLGVIELGGGRIDPTQSIDHSVGLTNLLVIGSHVSKEEPLFTIHANDEKTKNMAIKTLKQAYVIKETFPKAIKPLIHGEIQKSK